MDTAATSQTDDEYSAYLTRFASNFASRPAGEPLFRVDTTALWDMYLNGIEPSRRQHYNCRTCRKFVERFGGLVSVDDNGRLRSALWDHDALDELQEGTVALLAQVQRRTIIGVFISSESRLGTDRTGEWQHLSVAMDVYHATNAEQLAAQKLEDRRQIITALEEYSVDNLETAVTLLKSDALYRSENVLGAAEWLLRVRQMWCNPRCSRQNLLWREIALAPAGFCHPRSSMIGTLLDDLASGMGLEQVRRRFADKMRPTQYQRPSAAPAAGAIEAAERLVQQMGIERSLERRVARLDEVPMLWSPTPCRIKEATVFGHLKQGNTVSPLRGELDGGRITWCKLRDTVLPTATRITLTVPRGNSSFCGLLTAMHSDAPPIIQWDSLERRNPVSWYVYSHGSPASLWGLRGGDSVDVLGITNSPAHWYGASPHHGKQLFLMLDGAKDSSATPLCLFPEILKSELHGVRSVIEAHSRVKHPVKLPGAPNASGLMLSAGQTWNVAITVESGSIATKYVLDRWD